MQVIVDGKRSKALASASLEVSIAQYVHKRQVRWYVCLGHICNPNIPVALMARPAVLCIVEIWLGHVESVWGRCPQRTLHRLISSPRHFCGCKGLICRQICIQTDYAPRHRGGVCHEEPLTEAVEKLRRYLYTKSEVQGPIKYKLHTTRVNTALSRY